VDPSTPDEDLAAAAGDEPPKSTWALRLRLILQRFWQPTSACLTCMPGSLLANVPSLAHWELALRTGIATSLLVLVLSFTPLVRVFRNRWGNAATVGVLTACGDSYAHPDHYGHGLVEPLLTGLVSAVFALVASWLLEDRARRIRALFSR
jgi:hypothetical protein